MRVSVCVCVLLRKSRLRAVLKLCGDYITSSVFFCFVEPTMAINGSLALKIPFGDIHTTIYTFMKQFTRKWCWLFFCSMIKDQIIKMLLPTLFL